MGIRVWVHLGCYHSTISHNFLFHIDTVDTSPSSSTPGSGPSSPLSGNAPGPDGMNGLTAAAVPEVRVAKVHILHWEMCDLLLNCVLMYDDDE